MRRFYSLLLILALPFVFMRLYLKGRKNPLYRTRWKERLGFIPEITNSDQKIIWIHAVSVGEVEATVPLVKKLCAEFPDLIIIMTTTTPTGAETVKRRYTDQYGSEIIHYYTPYDLTGFQRRFINRIRPDLLIIMETELWPNMIYMCRQHNIPVILANARMAKRSAQGYQKIVYLSRHMFSGISVIAAQTDQDAGRFISLGADPDRVIVSGSLKFDQTIPDEYGKRSADLKKQIGTQRPVWIAASTHSGEEEQILEAHKTILETIPECLLILVPRHPERFNEVYHLCQSSSITTTRRSLDQPPSGQVYLVDTMGELLLCYGAADVAFVAGSLTPVGGHNLLEPASLGLPVMMGPHTFKIEKIFQMFLEAGAAFQISNPTELAEKTRYFLMNNQQRIETGAKAKKLVNDSQGSADRHLQLIKRLCDKN